MGSLGRISHLLSATELLTGLGSWLLAGVAVVVFIESGVLFPFLPGDSLLVTAAILRVSLGVALWKVVAVTVLAAIAGDQSGYWLGSRYGRRLFKDEARILRTDRLDDAEAFFERRGHLALVLGRFVPVVRTYVPFAAGTARMRYRSFVGWNVAGAVTWVGLMTAVGVLLGGVPGIASSIEGVMLVVIAVSMIPVVVPAARRWWASRSLDVRVDDELGGLVEEARSAADRDEGSQAPGSEEGRALVGAGGRR